MAVRFQLRRDTANNWASVNPVLALGEPGVETDTLKVKVGDGSNAWNSLGYTITTQFADLNGKPTTIAGYGITDNFLALTSFSVGAEGTASGDGAIAYDNTNGQFTYTPPDTSTFLTSVPAQTFASLTGKPTTLTGYGITDAVASSAISTFGGTLVDDADASAARTTLGLGTAATTAATAYATAAQGTTADSAIQQNTSPTLTNATLTGYLAGPAVFTIDPAAVGDNTGKVVIAGDLQVDGVQTTINSTTVSIDDLNFSIATDAADAAAANGAGITIGGAGATITYDSTNDEWDFNKPIDVDSVTVNTLHGGTTNFDIKQSTTDGADNKRTRIGGGGDVVNTRGAFIELHGNEHTSTGSAVINAGNVTGGEISLRTGGSEKVIITKDGEVGITNSVAPVGNLHVEDASGSQIWLGRTTNSGQTTASLGKITFGDTVTDSLLAEIEASLDGSTSNARLTFSTQTTGSQSTARMTILQSGNVGINSTDPGEALEVDGVIQIKRTGDHPAMRFVEDGNTRAYMGSGDWAINNLDDVDFGISSSATGDLVLGTNAGTEAMRIQTTSGNVGINTDNPQNTLHVQGSLTLEGSSGTDNAWTYYKNADQTYLLGIRGSSSDALSFYDLTTDAERMRIDTGGTIGVNSIPESTWSTVFDSRIRLGATGFVGSTSASTQLGNNWYYDGSAYKRIASDLALRYYQNGGDHVWETAVTGAADSTITWATKLLLGADGNLELGYNGAARQQADSQAFTITTPASGGGQGIAIKRLDSNTDQQIGEITFSNNTQDGQAGIRVKTQGASNTTDMHFDVNNAGTEVASALMIDGSQGGKISVVSREMSIQGMELRHGTFGIGNYNRRVEVSLGNYESAHVRIMAQRTNGGSCFVYWEGYINNNNNAGFSTAIAQRASDGTVSFTASISGGDFRWDFNASGSSGDGSFVVQGARGGASVDVTTY
jgi:hypothetical protein